MKKSLKKRVALGAYNFGLNILSRTPLVKKKLFRKYLGKYAYRTDPAYDKDVYERYSEMLAKHQIVYKDKIIMDVGSGDNYYHAYFFIKNGAKKFILCEPFADYLLDSVVLEKRGEILLGKKKFQEDRSVFENISVVSDHLEKLKHLDDSSVDIIISTSVFEHIDNVEKCIKECQRVLKSGGVMIHQIDIRDHADFEEPFNYLGYSSWNWRWLRTNSFVYTNRRRSKDFLDSLRRNKFTILQAEEDRQAFGAVKINREFGDYTQDELEVIRLLFVAKKN